MYKKILVLKEKLVRILKPAYVEHIILLIDIKRKINKRSRIYGNRNKWKNNQRYRF